MVEWRILLFIADLLLPPLRCSETVAGYANSTDSRNGSGALQQTIPMIRPFRLTT
jgi:hypothetical protein